MVVLLKLNVITSYSIHYTKLYDGVIIAKEIEIKGQNVNLNNNESISKFVGNTSEKNYDSNLLAYFDYDVETDSFIINWYSTIETGTFEVLVSEDDDNYKSVTSLVDLYTYTYKIENQIEKIYIKIKQTTSTRNNFV